MKRMGLIMGAVCALGAADAAAIDYGSPYYFAMRAQAAGKPDTEVLTMTHTYDAGWGFSAALGYNPPGQDRVWGNSRFEAEISYTDVGLDTIKNGGTVVNSNGETTTGAILLNYMYDFDFGGSVTPYMGLGAGISTVHMEFRDVVNAVDVDRNETTFAYQIRGGMRIAPPSWENTSLDLGYRFLSTGDVGYLTSDISNQLHQVELGLNIDF